MAKPTTRQEFKEYCLRKLGAPVLEINVADEQIEDRIDEALSFWADYHYNGSELIYLRHQLTQEDVDRGYVVVPERLLGVVKIWDLSNSLTGGSGIFNVSYQFVLNNVTDIVNYDIQNYYMTMQHIEFLKEILVGKPLIRYNAHSNRVYIDVNKASLVVGSYIIIEAYDIVDVDVYSDVWQDRWLQNYTTVLIKLQWAINLTKFNNMQLVGGVMFDATQMLSDAKEEKQTMEEQLITTLQPLVFNFVG